MGRGRAEPERTPRRRRGLDASLLAVPLRKVVRAGHPRMTATTAAIAERLPAGDGLLYRHLHDQSPDGLPGDEGVFLLCSFWLADNLALQGRIEQAEELYVSLCSRASPLGLLPEQIGRWRPRRFRHDRDEVRLRRTHPERRFNLSR
ncbi:glycoside hydrolase family 15 protein [Spirillospora sp. CA-255316]